MELVKKKYKLILLIIVGIIIVSGISVYATTYLASNITYKRQGTNVNTVSEALNDLYSISGNLEHVVTGSFISKSNDDCSVELDFTPSKIFFVWGNDSGSADGYDNINGFINRRNKNSYIKSVGNTTVYHTYTGGYTIYWTAIK